MLLFIKLGLFDIVDILIVAFILFQLYRLVKGTAAVNILAGIFTIYLAWLLMKAFNMKLITSILGQFMSVGVIALLIVFQQEVRRFLLLLGSRYNLQNIFNLNKFFAKPAIGDAVADAIVTACVNFSATKTGALIVFQLNTELYNYAQSGVMLKSLVSSELIENIFWKNTPLHDGAVIIKDNRIAVAAAYLPLSDSKLIPKELGTRHRAAVGISEVTDALTIVISEETGEVSITKDNELIRNMSQNDYLKFMRSQLCTHEPTHDNLLTRLYSHFERQGGGQHGQK